MRAQEHIVERHQDELVKEAKDVRGRVLQGLDALDQELQKVRKEAENLPSGLSMHKPRRRFWPWLNVYTSY